jgi:hypothetical protein
MTQLSYAAQLCQPATALFATMNDVAVLSGTATHADPAPSALDLCRPGAAAEAESCIASPRTLAAGIFAAHPAFEPLSIPARRGNVQWSLVSDAEIASVTGHPAPPHSALRTLFCRYLI